MKVFLNCMANDTIVHTLKYYKQNIFNSRTHEKKSEHRIYDYIILSVT